MCPSLQKHAPVASERPSGPRRSHSPMPSAAPHACGGGAAAPHPPASSKKTMAFEAYVPTRMWRTQKYSTRVVNYCDGTTQQATHTGMRCCKTTHGQSLTTVLPLWSQHRLRTGEAELRKALPHCPQLCGREMLPTREFLALSFKRSIGDGLHHQHITSARGFSGAVLDQSQEVGRAGSGLVHTFWVRDPQLVA